MVKFPEKGMDDNERQFPNANLVQLQNPVSKRYVRINRKKGTLKVKMSDGPFKGVPIIRPKKIIDAFKVKIISNAARSYMPLSIAIITIITDALRAYSYHLA